MKYKLISITDHNNIEKDSALEEIKELFPSCTGEFYNLKMLIGSVCNNEKVRCCFMWDDDPECMMRTSNVTSVIEFDNKVKVATTNSVYIFERL